MGDVASDIVNHQLYDEIKAYFRRNVNRHLISLRFFMIIHNPPFSPLQGIIAVFLSWFLSQLAKVIRGWRFEKRFNFRWLFDTGGMPSSHSAGVCALATAVGITTGARSTLFAVTCIFAFTTMFDAQGVRRQSGKQAEALNRILDDLYAQKGIQLDPLKELFGHTPRHRDGN